MFSIFSFYSVPSFASGIEADSSGAALPADCDSDTLDTTSGTANLRADFDANTIDLRWYDNNTLLNVSSTSSNTCTYDTTISLPTNPTKKGYTFKGWKVRPEYDMDQLDASLNGIESWNKSIGSNADFCRYYSQQSGVVQDCNQYAEYRTLNRHEWKTVFSYGTIYGASKCVTANMSESQIDSMAQGSGEYCKCKVTGYKPNNSNTIYGPKKKMNWVHYASAGDISYCLRQCAMYCSYMSMVNGIGAPGNCSTCRRQLFGQSGS